MKKVALKKDVSSALTLTELLIVVVVIGVIVTIGVPVIGNIRESAKRATAMQNAKNVASLSEGLAALGVAHVIPDSMGGVEATARLMREGVVVPEGPMAGEIFILSGMRDSEIEEVAVYLRIRYGEKDLQLVFQQPAGSGTSVFNAPALLYAVMHAALKGVASLANS
ncbi:MAG: hypothetical protein AAGA96_06550 [Verrucomicrobiota bacterium]